MMRLKGCCRCHLCGDHVDATNPEHDEGICCDCMADITRPGIIRAMAGWFDDPHRTPSISVSEGMPNKATLGMLLRLIADEYETILDLNE